jgi:transcriptional regulator with XRE-family HTH domain
MEYMAHPPDQALSRAIRQVIHEARTHGRTTRDLATYFGVSDPTISRWESGGRLPALDLLPAFDRLVDRERGYTLRLAGYVDNQVDLRAAIVTAPELDSEARNVLLEVYDVLCRQTGRRDNTGRRVS